MVTTEGVPVEYTFLPGSKHDSEALKQLPFNLGQGSRVYADAGYTNYKIEDMLQQAEKIELLVARKSNSKRKREPYQEFLIESMRKRVETTFSEISTLLPKKIHAVTDYGFILKVIIFLFSYTLNKIEN
jgi:Transposase DDE domain